MSRATLVSQPSRRIVGYQCQYRAPVLLSYRTLAWEQYTRRSRAIRATSMSVLQPSHRTISYSRRDQDRAIVLLSYKTPTRERCARRSRAIRAISTLQPSHRTVSYQRQYLVIRLLSYRILTREQYYRRLKLTPLFILFRSLIIGPSIT